MIRLFFGSPGSGKTTCAVRNILAFKKKGSYKRYYSNFDTEVSHEISLEGLGDWTLPARSHLTVDESGIEYNNRKFKTLSQKTIEWFKLHRHYRVDVDFYSQSWEDTDITIRRLADDYVRVRRLGPFTSCRRVKRFVTVDDDSKQIVDGYELRSLFDNLFPWKQNSWWIFFRPRYYKLFDSYSTPEGVPVKYNYNIYD